jgi:hypothetical protein
MDTITPTTSPRRRAVTSAVRWAALPIGLAIVARIVVALTNPSGLYFPDSWCYVIRTDGPPCLAHDPAMGWWWSIGTFGIRSATSVLWFQAVLGVATVAVVYWTLTRIGRVWIAVAGASLLAVLPIQLLMERTFLTEAFETFAIAVGLAFALMAIRATKALRAVAALVAADAAFSCALSVHTAFLIPGLLTVFALSVLVLVRLWGLVEHRAPLVVALPVLCVLGLLVPAIPEAATYHRWFGVWTTDVAQGTFLLTRWSPIIPCALPAGATERATLEIKAACKLDAFGTPPGITQSATWRSPFTYGVINRRDIARERVAKTETQLTGVTLVAISKNPGPFALQMLASLGWQAAGLPVNDLWQYRVPRPEKLTAAEGRVFPNLTEWFGRDGIQANPHPDVSLLRANSGTTRAGQILLLAAILGGLVRLGRRLRRGPPGQRFASLSLEHTPRTGLAVISSIMVGTSMLTIAFGTYPVFRYWAPLIPALIILVALVLPPREAGSEPSSP